MTDNIFATGSCLCGNVKYSISAEPLFMGQCHCEDCRKTSGTGHISNAFFPTSSVKIEGETRSYDSTADSGVTLTRQFCPNCGSRLFGQRSSTPEIIGVAVGCLDNSDWFKPAFIVYNSQKPVWDFMDESLPTFEMMPPVQG